jgi:(p)ppGpp synthase/HD superfamily hydrolase
MRLLVKRALDHAAILHRDQVRKYPGVRVPYVSHAAGVALLLAKHGFPDEVVAAGALHDVIEDCNVTHGELEKTYGARVADLVRDVSEADKTESWEARKAAYAEHFARKSWEAQAITLADKTDNFESIVLCTELYGDPWAMFKRGRDAQLTRFEEIAVIARALPAHPLIDAFEAALEAVRRV